MLSQFWSCGIPLIILLCWLSANDAVPFGPQPEAESHSSESPRKTTHIAENPRGATKKSAANLLEKLPNIKKKNSNFNQNINVNKIHSELVALAENVFKPKKQRIKNDTNEKSDILADSVQTPEIPKEEQISPEKCVNEVRKKNQIYTRSFPMNISSIDEEFKIAGEAEAKKTSSVHIGEDIALCWIETTTIKEDPTFDPPKRLVLREFTISFENSATIPDKYLECDKLDGEIATGDEETVRKTSIHEVIDENTRRSRVVNFTSVSHVGLVVVTQHKKVRCSVGSVVSKDIYEWPDGTENPKKRVEIKVGPSIRKNDEKSAECITSNFPESPEMDKTASNCGFGESCDIPMEKFCKEGENCDKLNKDSCEGADCPLKNPPKETITTTEPPDSDDLLGVGVTRRASTKGPEEIPDLKESSTPLPNESIRGNNDSCSEDDIDCASRKPKINDEISGKINDDPAEIATEKSGEACEKGSANCFCNGSSCSIHHFDKPKRLETGDKRDETKKSGENDFSGEESQEKDDSSIMNSAETTDSAEGTSESHRQDLKYDANSSCDENDNENCKPTDSRSDIDFTSESLDETNLSTSSEFDEESISANSESQEVEDVNENVNVNINHNTNTNGFNDETPRKANKGTSKIRTTSELPRTSISSDSESTECSSDSEFSDCTEESISPSSVEKETILRSDQGETTVSAESCESSGSCKSTVEILNSTESNEMTTALTNDTEKTGESICKNGDCKSSNCDSVSGICSEESNKPTAESVTTTTEAVSKDLEYSSSTSMANVSTTAETRRSTPQISSPNKSHHRLALRVKVLLEHINENKEKEKLVQVEKHLMLNENPNEEGNHTLLWKIKSLNNTMNMETLKAIFNCSDFEKLSDSVNNLTESGRDRVKIVSPNVNSEDKWDEDTLRKKREANTTEITTEGNFTISQNVTEKSMRMDKNITEKNLESNETITKQNFAESANHTESQTVKNKNTTEANISKDKNTVKVDRAKDKNIAKEIAEKKNITEAKATAIRETLPGVEEDIKKGLDHVFSQISKEIDVPAKSGVEKAAESSSSILKILASPADGRIHFRRRRRIENLGGVLAVDALKNPVKGEEIDRWSTERLVAAADGSKVRAVTEFKLLRDAVEDSQRTPIGN